MLFLPLRGERCIRVERLAYIEPLHQHIENDRQWRAEQDPDNAEQETSRDQREKEERRRDCHRPLLN